MTEIVETARETRTVRGGTRPPPITGRTQWDFAAEVAKLLGWMLPMFVGLALAGYFLVAAQNKQADVLKYAHGVLKDSNDALRANSAAQVNDFKSSLELGKALRKDADEARLELEKARQEKQKAAEEAREAQASKEESIKLAAQAKVAREQAEGDVASLKQQSDQLANAIKLIKIDLENQKTNSSGDLAALKNDLKALSEAVRDGRNDTKAKAAELLAKYFGNHERSIQAYAEKGADGPDGLRLLVGLDAAALKTLILKPDVPGTWLTTGEMPDRDRGAGATWGWYFGIMKIEGGLWHRIIQIHTSDGRVSYVSLYDRIAAIEARDVTDWTQQNVFQIGEAAAWSEKDRLEDRITLSTALPKSSGEWWMFGSAFPLSLIKGTKPDLTLMKAAEFRRSLPEIYNTIKTNTKVLGSVVRIQENSAEDAPRLLRLALQMEENAETLNGAALVGNIDASDEIKAAMAKVVEAVVKSPSDPIVANVSGKARGKLAALVLKPGVRFERINRVRIEQSGQMPIRDEGGRESVAEIIISINPRETNSAVGTTWGRVVMGLRNGKWVLESWEDLSPKAARDKK